MILFNSVWIAIDVCKARLDVAVRPSGELSSEANAQAGIKALTKKLKRFQSQFDRIGSNWSRVRGGLQFVIRRIAARGGQPETSTRLRSRHRETGKDGPDRCASAGTFCGSGPAYSETDS